MVVQYCNTVYCPVSVFFAYTDLKPSTTMWESRSNQIILIWYTVYSDDIDYYKELRVTNLSNQQGIIVQAHKTPNQSHQAYKYKDS